MSALKTILIIEDKSVNREILAKILSDNYNLMQAENGQEALELLKLHIKELAGIILDLIMPVMDGFEFLKFIQENKQFKNIPIIVSTENGSKEHELKALELGAWDFISKPYDAKILLFRLRNAIERSQLLAFQQLKYLAEYDDLTGIYNKAKFFLETRKMLDANSSMKFAFIRFDIDRFQLINSFYGSEEGNNFLRYLAQKLKDIVMAFKQGSYGRIEADVFACCISYIAKDQVKNSLQKLNNIIKSYNKSFDIVPVFGIYFLDDISLPVDIMLDKATLAAKTCKGKYIDTMAVYISEMSLRLEQEQEIINEMNAALEKEEFIIYLQPKYSLSSNTSCGAEALVRWLHPQKGMIYPNVFIPVFEKNGFVSRLDYYVWESICRLLRHWLDAGIKPYPISVNVSRVNLYNPHIVETICSLIAKYKIPAPLLQLELTESAYSDNPQTMKQVVSRLQEKNFTILMDDFGNGYSSLSILKDIEVDALKIDMRFLEKSEIEGRGENIIASIVRMAKWLNIPAIAEGIEKSHQVDFLKSIGCEYVQGYYFACPMPVAEYEELVKNNIAIEKHQTSNFDMNTLWSSNPQMEMLFSNATQAACIYEFENQRIEVLRFNKAFYELLNLKNVSLGSNPLDQVLPEYRSVILETFNKSIALTNGFAECEYQRKIAENKNAWFSLKLKYINQIGSRKILFGSLFDITSQKNIEEELKKYKKVVNKGCFTTNRMLIVDDSRLEREVLKSIFADRFIILEAKNGQEALEIMEKNNANIDIILLDVVMPIMDGVAFLEGSVTTNG